MIAPPNWQTEMHDVLDRLQDGGFDDADRVRLNELLRAGEPHRDYFITYMDVHSRLAWEGGHETANEPPRHIDFESEISNPAFPTFPVPTLSTNHYPLTTDFVGGPVFSYMVATVVLCAMLLGAWVYKISNVGNLPDGMADKSRIETPYTPMIVGQITGMKDCRWGEDEPGTIVGASVSLGRKYSLESGLLQITYITGANVILEGPCVFKADSNAGGRLQFGKLVARVENKVASGQWPVASAKPQAANPQPPVPSPSPLAPLFSVTTPTAVITDLGTEFGVEVNKDGDTISRVFQGSVRVETVGDGSRQDVVLRENESIRVSRVRETHHDSTMYEQVRFTHPTAPPKFVRQMPQTEIKTLDLVDVVAGGDGFSGRRDSGIDPTNGRIWKHRVDTGDYLVPLEGDGQYYRVAELPFVDGVFIPDGGGAAVQVDSTGHVFDWFSDTSNVTWRPIWAGGAFSEDHKYSSNVGGVDYASPGHGLLLMLANNAITFDLEAIRRANLGSKLLRFRTTAGMPGNESVTKQYFADVLVLVGGARRFQQRLEYNGRNAASISVAIQDKDRFLTLAVTDAGDGFGHDWVVLGDPCLVFSQTQQKQNAGGRSMNEP